MALPYDIHSNPTFIGTQQAKDMVRDVATGRRTMVLICSDTGFRKSYETKHCLRQCRVPFHECAPSTESALVRVLWGIESGLILHKGRKPAVMVADDQDAIWQRPTIANQMKSVFGSDRRCVIFETPEAMKNKDRRNSEDAREKARYKPTIAPPTFDVLVRLISLANLNYTDPAVVAGLSEHFRALVSKGLDPHWIPNDAEHDGRDVFLHTHWLATEGNSLRSEGFPYEVARRAVEFYVNKVHLLIDICPRRLSQIAYTILNNPDPLECEKRLSHMLRDTDQRPKLILPESWIQVLLWPESPPRRPDPARQPDPPPAATTPGPVELEPDRDPPPAASAPIPVEAATSEPIDPRERQQQMPDVGEDVDRESLGQIASGPSVPPDPEPVPAIQEPPIEGASPDGVERNCVRGRDAILNMVLPSGDSRQGAFLGAVEQMKAMGENVDEPVLAFIRRMAIRPDGAAKLFEPDSVGEIIAQAKAMMAWFGPIDSVRETDPVPTIHQIANALSDEEIAEITRRYDLRAFRGRAGELDVVAYRRRAALLKIAGPRLTRDQVAIVRRKPKVFWQEQDAAERWLIEMLDLSARDDVPQ